MPIAIKPGTNREYVLRAERFLPGGVDDEGNPKEEIPNPKPTVFLLRNLTLAERQVAAETMKGSLDGPLEELVRAQGGASLEAMWQIKVNFEATASVLRLGLVGWRDFPTQGGGHLEFETEDWDGPDGKTRQAVKRDLIDYLTTGDVMELANAIVKQSELEATDRGNSRRSD